MKKTINNAVTTNHEKNLDYIQDNCPELLDDYIEAVTSDNKGRMVYCVKLKQKGN